MGEGLHELNYQVPWYFSPKPNCLWKEKALKDGVVVFIGLYWLRKVMEVNG